MSCSIAGILFASLIGCACQCHGQDSPTTTRLPYFSDTEDRELRGRICNPESDEFKHDSRLFEQCRQYALDGNAFAAFSIGFMYSNGAAGVVQNPPLGCFWYGVGALEGDGDAQFYYAFCWGIKGTGYPRNIVLNHLWANLAATTFAKQDGEYAARMRQRAIDLRDRAAAVMNKKELAEAYKRAADLSASGELPEHLDRERISAMLDRWTLNEDRNGKRR
jgi:TPR repeat protein